MRNKWFTNSGFGRRWMISLDAGLDGEGGGGGTSVAERIEGKLDEIDEKYTGRAAALEERAETLETENTDLKGRVVSLEDKLRDRVTRGPEAGEDRPKPVSLMRLCRGIALERLGRPDPWGQSSYEREIITECEKKRSTLIAGQDTLGGYFIQPQYMPEKFIEMLRAKTVLTELGVTNMPGLAGSPVQVPKQTATATAYYTDEHTAPTKTNPTAGLASLSPKALRGLVEMSKLSLMMANPALDTFVQNDLAAVITRRRELAVLQGTGGDYQPLGLINHSGVGSSTINAVPSDLDDFDDIVYAVELANADKGRLGWLMHPREWKTLRTLKDGTGRYLLPQAPDGSTPKMLKGYPVACTTQVPINLGGTSNRGRIIFGDWSQLVDGEWDGMTFDISDKSGTNWDKGIVGILATLYHDTLVRQAAAFVIDNTIDS